MLAVVWLGAAVAGPIATAAPAGAQVGEVIRSYHVDVDVRLNGTIHVREVIDYDFGATPRHGILRKIPVRFHHDGRYDRIYPIEDLDVTASPGTPDDVDVKTESLKTIRIGDPDKRITGPHQYVLDYDVEGALNGFSEHDELNWNAIGTEWSVPINKPSVTVSTPVPTNGVTCFAGAFGSSAPCASAGAPGSTTTEFSNPDLSPGEGLTVVISLPKGAVTATGPVLDERWAVQRAFALTPSTVGAAALLLLLATGGIGWLFWRQGRDRRMAQGPSGPLSGVEGPSGPLSGVEGPSGPLSGVEGPSGTAEEPVPLFDDRDGPVLYRPPEGLRPAQLGVLVDEKADPLDVTATMVDLAVRGYLTIEEVERESRWSRGDWNLTEKKPADGDLLPYERSLLASLFAGRVEVKLSELKDTFHDDLERIAGELYDDSVAQGWFAKRPDKVRSKWLVAGIALTVVGAALVVLTAAFTHAGLVFVPVLLAGVVMAVGHRWMPARTAKGSAALAQVLGFRRYIETAEADRMQFAEQENIWATYLPYAIVFGATKRWAKVFDGLGARQQAQVSTWYVSPYAFSGGSFSESMDGFADSTSGAIVSTPSSSGGSGFSGGFSGGGGGGGGGGSW